MQGDSLLGTNHPPPRKRVAIVCIDLSLHLKIDTCKDERVMQSPSATTLNYKDSTRDRRDVPLEFRFIQLRG